MKLSPPLIFQLLLYACTSKQMPIQGERVAYPGGTLASLTELIHAIEIVRLQHDDSIMTDDRVRLLQRDSSFYLVDILGEKNIYRFARDGRFLNRIGQKGQGPEELTYPVPKFSSFGGQAYFWRFPFPMVYHLTDNTVQQAVFFEFKGQYFPEKDITDKKSMRNENLTCISKYWESDTHTLVEIGRVKKDRKSGQNIYGIKNKASGQWQWVEYITTPEKPFIPDWYPGRIQDFAQDGRLMCFFFGNEMEELTDEARKLVTNPEELENIDPEMDMFVLLCRLKK